MERILSMTDTPKSNGSISVRLTASTTNDITIPSGTRRIVVKVPAGAVAIRIRAGISGSASHTADVTTNVPATTAYIDAVCTVSDTNDEIVDMRFADDVTWLRTWNSTTATPDIQVTFYSAGATPMKLGAY
jgi:hypothetical protein